MATYGSCRVGFRIALQLCANEINRKGQWMVLTRAHYGHEHEDERIRSRASTRQPAEERMRLAPAQGQAFRTFSESVFAEGAVPAKTKQLIAVAVAHVTQCPYCIRSHTRTALQQGASGEEIMEAIWVAAEMRAGGAYAHSVLALETIAEVERGR
jgi:AhpD family alkylhydroperoxidase